MSQRHLDRVIYHTGDSNVGSKSRASFGVFQSPNEFLNRYYLDSFALIKKKCI